MMKLAKKMVLALGVTLACVAALFAFVRLREEQQVLTDEMSSDQLQFGHALVAAMRGAQARHEQMRGGTTPTPEVHGRTRVRYLALGGLPRDVRQSLSRGRDASRLEGRTMVSWVPYRRDGAVLGAVEVAEALSVLRLYTDTSLRQTVLTTAAMILASVLLTTVFSVRVVGRPLGRLVAHARAVAAGDLTTRTTLRQRDEVGELAIEMNAMTEHLLTSKQRTEDAVRERISALEQLRHSDRLRTVGQLAAGLAHELGTPLNVVAGHAQLIASAEGASEEVIASAGVVEDQCKRMTALVRQLLSYARRGEPRLEPVDVRDVAASTRSLLAPMARGRKIELRLEVPDEPVNAPVDGVQLQQALTNLVVNALDATPEGGEVTLRVDRARLAPPEGGAARDVAAVEVSDTGRGLTAEQLARVFEPFFSTKETGQGTGLGLPIVEGIARDHGGWVGARSEPGRGSAFTLYVRT